MNHPFATENIYAPFINQVKEYTIFSMDPDGYKYVNRIGLD